ncbi:hypothetical protein C8R43DRAFT_1232083 [Mycena crocata]|nr:hypothetical protein C8R43DRAFT_1232083 [Mycena crocata]
MAEKGGGDRASAVLQASTVSFVRAARTLSGTGGRSVVFGCFPAWSSSKRGEVVARRSLPATRESAYSSLAITLSSKGELVNGKLAVSTAGSGRKLEGRYDALPVRLSRLDNFNNLTSPSMMRCSLPSTPQNGSDMGSGPPYHTNVPEHLESLKTFVDNARYKPSYEHTARLLRTFLQAAEVAFLPPPIPTPFNSHKNLIMQVTDLYALVEKNNSEITKKNSPNMTASLL